MIIRSLSPLSRGAALAVLCCLSAGFAAAQPSTVQTIRGQVVEQGTRMPLPGAAVVLPGTDPLVGTTTDAQGWFVLPGVPLGRHDVRITFLGYEPVRLPMVLVTSGKEVVLHVEMKEQVLSGEEVVVTADLQKDRPLNDLAFVSGRSFTVEEARRYAGGLDDPARMASAFAGISTGGGIEENAMIIRGNAPKGVLWRLEGIEIPNPSHFAGLSVAGGGGLTLFSSHLLADSDFFTGAFPAEYGNALAGVFDMSFRAGNRAQREHILQVGLLGIDVASEGPFVRGAPSTYLFNYRYSTLGLLLPLLPTEDVATYQDLSFKMSFPARKAGRFDVWGLGGLDRQTMAASADSAAWEYETWDRLDAELALDVGAVGLSHSLVLGRRSFLKTTAAATVNRTRLDQLRMGDDLVLHDDLSLHSTTGRLVLGTSLNHKLSARHTVRAGVTANQLFYNLDVQAAPDHQVPLVTVAQGRGSSLLLQAYAQSRFDVTARVSVHAGLHAQHFALTRRTSVEPRIGARWEGGRHALSVGYGLHSQIEDMRLYFARPADGLPQPNRRLDFTRAHHGVIGFDRRLNQVTMLKVEAYYQWLFGVPVIADSSYSLLNFEQDFTFDAALTNGGAGRNAGIEATLQRFLSGDYYYLLTGSLFRSRYRGGDGVWRSTRFDRGYTVNGLAGREFALGQDDLLGLNGRLTFMGGRRRSPVDEGASRARAEVVYDERRAFEEQEPALFIFDLTVTYRRNYRRFSEEWALQIKNLLVAQNTSMVYNLETQRVEEVGEGFPLPVLSYKIEF